jgi:thiol:disulfide interchange protein DsbC
MILPQQEEIKVKKTRLSFIPLLAVALTQSSYASDIHSKIQSKIQKAIGEQPFVINDYDGQLKEVVVDSNVYFTTHDGRYLFAGPILDTQRGIEIVGAKENNLRHAYLDSLPQEVFVSYPSSGPSKYQITVFTDIDCPYCRQMHNYMPNFNQSGISVNYVMLPRAGVGSESHKKTVSALCAANPAESITSAMLNKTPAPRSCKTNVMDEHLDIARNLKIRSTPSIVLPSGRVKVGLTNPDQLIALLEGENK